MKIPDSILEKIRASQSDDCPEPQPEPIPHPACPSPCHDCGMG